MVVGASSESATPRQSPVRRDSPAAARSALAGDLPGERGLAGRGRQPRTGIGSYLPGDPMEQGEDCFALNIWTAGCDAVRRPVVVFLHGGAFLSEQEPASCIAAAGFAGRGVVLVTLNYRLGFLGFLAHPELDSGGARLANRGLLDQLCALEWVEKNIAEFAVIRGM